MIFIEYLSKIIGLLSKYSVDKFLGRHIKYLFLLVLEIIQIIFLYDRYKKRKEISIIIKQIITLKKNDFFCNKQIFKILLFIYNLHLYTRRKYQ